MLFLYAERDALLTNIGNLRIGHINPNDYDAKMLKFTDTGQAERFEKFAATEEGQEFILIAARAGMRFEADLSRRARLRELRRR